VYDTSLALPCLSKCASCIVDAHSHVYTQPPLYATLFQTPSQQPTFVVTSNKPGHACFEDETITFTATATSTIPVIAEYGFDYIWTLADSDTNVATTQSNVLTYPCSGVGAHPVTVVATASGVYKTTPATETNNVNVMNGVVQLGAVKLVQTDEYEMPIATAFVGESLTIRIPYSDPSPSNEHTITLDLGDGTAVFTDTDKTAQKNKYYEKEFSYSKVSLANTAFMVVVTVTDNGAVPTTATTSLAVVVTRTVSVFPV
jgi:hypothetical protein